jgi:hypothetical protein
VRMHAETGIRSDYVVVDNPKRSETHPVGITVIGKTEAEPARKPPEFGDSSFGSTGNDLVHGFEFIRNSDYSPIRS